MSKDRTGYPIDEKTERLTAHTVWHVADMSITGNVTPRVWYQRIVTPSGSADTIAITLLSEIVYRYSPTKESKGKSQSHEDLRKQFKGALLQKSYSELKKDFNLTKRQFEAAAQRLEELGLITRHLKHGVWAYGKVLNHVLYFQLHYGRLRELTCSETWDTTPARIRNSQTTPDVPTAPSGAVTTPERAVTEPDGAVTTPERAVTEPERAATVPDGATNTKSTPEMTSEMTPETTSDMAASSGDSTATDTPSGSRPIKEPGNPLGLRFKGFLYSFDFSKNFADSSADEKTQATIHKAIERSAETYA